MDLKVKSVRYLISYQIVVLHQANGVGFKKLLPQKYLSANIL
jgi:hypothetical protein